MLAYILRRLLFLPVIWFLVTISTFLFMAPLGVHQRLGIYVQVNPESLTSKLSPEQFQRLIEKYGLADPFYVQYWRWLDGVLHGNWGWSKTAQAPVADALAQRIPVSLELTLFAIAPVILLAIVLGIRSAVKKGRLEDQLIRAVTISGYSLPSFVFGLFALLIFYGILGWFPPGRLSLYAEQIVFSPAFHRFTGLVTVDAVLNGRLDILVDALRHLVLPMVTLSYISWAGLTQVTRSSMLETLGQEYVTAARARGIPERRVIYDHARRNAMIPVTTLSLGAIVGLVLGVFITETVFNIRGLGFWGVQAALQYDVPAMLGITVFDTTLIVLGNLAIDIAYTIVDPRIRYS